MYVSVCVDLDVLVLVDVDGILEASSLIVRNEAELFHGIEVDGMNEFTVRLHRIQMEAGHGISTSAYLCGRLSRAVRPSSNI